jgi:hypothetical protein
MRNYPELKFTKEWYDMTREEQMKAWWEMHAKWYKLNPDRYNYSI